MIQLQEERERHRVERVEAKARRRRLVQPAERKSELIDYYAAQTKTKPVSRRRERREIIFPPVFSFIEAPDEALATLRDLVRFVAGRKTEVIGIQQQACTLIDLCAESVASVLGLEANRSLKVGFRGVFPNSKNQREIILATGLPKRLGVALPEPEGFLTFELFRGRRASESAFKSSPREIQADRMTRYVNECLARYGFRMGPEIAGYLASLVGEVIGNAEDHSGTGSWWIAAYLHQASDVAYGDCHITIFDFGKTLSATLQELPPSALLRRNIEALVETHTRLHFFGPRWTVENLWTLYALQEGVSRYNSGADSLGYRGYGTVDMIEFFQRLGQSPQSQPRMCIVSGRTHISFDNRYTMQPQITWSGETRRIIAFNKDNDLGKPPEAGYVKQLGNFFPGTLISLRFYLDKRHLQASGGSP